MGFSVEGCALWTGGGCRKCKETRMPKARQKERKGSEEKKKLVEGGGGFELKET